MEKKCKICGHATKKINVNIVNSVYYECDYCGYIYKDPEYYLTEKEEYQRYCAHKNSIEDSGYVAYLKDFIEKAVIPFSSEKKKALDFGSGPNPVLATILKNEYGFKMDIYDYFFSPEKIFDGKKYDLITSTEVVEHLADPMKYFALFRELLSEDGILAIMTNFHPQNYDKFSNWHYVRDKTHISFFTKRTMEIIAEILGFEIIYCDDKKLTTFRKIL